MAKRVLNRIIINGCFDKFKAAVKLKPQNMKTEDMRRRIEKEIGKVYCWDKATHEFPVLVEKKFGFAKRFTSITAAYKYYFN